MDSENVRYLLLGLAVAGLFWVWSLAGGGSRWKRTLRSIGLAAGLGFVVFPDPHTGAWHFKHVLTLLIEMSEHPYPIEQVLAVGLGLAFWCIWLAVAFVLLGFMPERPRDARRAEEAPPPAQERQEPRFAEDGDAAV